ncbi:PHP domain-containing protein [Paludibaculum fermentans]|uniref:PHP domain-containing protein n=1 Tax=Paludibaculum fermentans TaxID=1473598 RepID=UPI003EBF26D1
MKKGAPKRVSVTSRAQSNASERCGSLPVEYFRIRDFEYVQPLYDLAFLLEVDALAKGAEVPKYRTFSLWRAAYSLDGYGTTIDRWLDGTAIDQDLDYVPSSRIREYLATIRKNGTIPELRSYRHERFDRCLRLRSVRGLGPNKIALTVTSRALAEEWFSQVALDLSLDRDRIIDLYQGRRTGPWQTAHLVPPLLRFLKKTERLYGAKVSWAISGITDPFQPVTETITVLSDCAWVDVKSAFSKSLRSEKLFRQVPNDEGDAMKFRHQMGWTFIVRNDYEDAPKKCIPELAETLDPISREHSGGLKADLHLHTAWSDGSASVNTMATAAVANGLEYFAVTDHSRSSKLQGGLTPLLWLRQASALELATPLCPVLHGIEVDILKDGALDLPSSLLNAADLVVASVHTNWTSSARVNTDRLLKAIESGCVDILAHPTSAIIGKPGVPDYHRPPADVNWDEVIPRCAQWKVALEMNCFPSRLDLPLNLLKQAIEAGCAISIGSDAHSRSHLLNRRFGDVALERLNAPLVLNRLSYVELKQWIKTSRACRRALSRNVAGFVQSQLQFGEELETQGRPLSAGIQPPQRIPSGSRIVGIDLTAGDKATGLALLDGYTVHTCSMFSDAEIIAFIEENKPAIVSIDSPLGLPGGGTFIDPKSGIVRIAEYDLASVGIPAYPALIDSMQNLTLRGIGLRRALEGLSNAPRVIESYPGAAQDILSIPRKQKSLDLLREGLRRLGLQGPGLETRSHDEMDAVTSAIVGRYFESGLFEPMGVPSEAQLIVPKVSPLVFDDSPIICLAGKTGAGKSVVARYLSIFYGFKWVRTRNIIEELLREDLTAPLEHRLSDLASRPDAISEEDLRTFGAVILTRHRQIPLRKKLSETLRRNVTPIVVDSIRDTVDVDPAIFGNRPVLTWFVDCSDSIINQRLATRAKVGEKRTSTGSPVDQTASSVRRHADALIPNGGTLEELRWRIDDTLFASITLRR